MTITFFEFMQNKKKAEMEALEEELRAEEKALQAEYEAFLALEEAKRQAEQQALWGLNPSVEALRVWNGAPFLVQTDEVSQVINITPVKSLEQLTHAQQSELHNLERGVFGRLANGFNNFTYDEELLSRAYTQRLEEFDGIAVAHEFGQRKGLDKRTIDTLLETKSPTEAIQTMKLHS